LRQSRKKGKCRYRAGRQEKRKAGKERKEEEVLCRLPLNSNLP
jgi:hypothetical protein